MLNNFAPPFNASRRRFSCAKTDLTDDVHPTRGVDVAVKQAMYKIINEMKKSGKAILLISEEMLFVTAGQFGNIHSRINALDRIIFNFLLYYLVFRFGIYKSKLG